MPDSHAGTQSLFSAHVHSPSFAKLTNNFEHADQLKDYCIPVNSYFPTPEIMMELYRKLPHALKYYPSGNAEIAEAVCRFAGIADPETVLVGNGSTELISWLNTLCVKTDLLVPVPSFGRWTDEPTGLGRHLHTLNYDEQDQFHLTPETFVQEVRRSGTKAAVLCNPNNPTGSLMEKRDVLWVMDQLRDLDAVVIDESFIDFSRAEIPTVKDEVASFPNAWVLKSLGKNLGLHGVRMGYVISSRANIATLKRHVPFWNVNGVAEHLLKLIANDAAKADYEQSRLRVIADREYLKAQFETLPGVTVFPANGNFIYFKLSAEIDGDELRNRLLVNHGCFVRNCGNKIGGDRQFFRIAARPKADVDHLVVALRSELTAQWSERVAA